MGYWDAVWLVIGIVFVFVFLFIIGASIVAYPIFGAVLGGSVIGVMVVAWVIYKIANR